MWDIHAIQLVTINYQKLNLEVNNEVFDPQNYRNDSFSMQTGSSGFDPETNEIMVGLRILNGFDEEGNKDPECDFWMEIQLEGVFTVNPDEFSIEKIPSWAKGNAPLILYPYAREVAYSLTNRIFKDSAALLPLLTVPTVKK